MTLSFAGGNNFVKLCTATFPVSFSKTPVAVVSKTNSSNDQNDVNTYPKINAITNSKVDVAVINHHGGLGNLSMGVSIIAIGTV